MEKISQQLSNRRKKSRRALGENTLNIGDLHLVFDPQKGEITIRGGSGVRLSRG